ncbi:MAG: hypothetical protein M3R10_08330 [Verrucomicrobiota bacterium]|nr:hypothetical protein [Verrucomicrobiota bacterium]
MNWRAPFFRWVVFAGTTGVVVACAYLLDNEAADPGVAKLLAKRKAETTDLPFAVYALDSRHPDLSSVIGGPTGQDLPADLLPLWTGSRGENYSVTSTGGLHGAGGLYEVSPDGRVRPLHDFLDTRENRSPPIQSVSPEVALNNILDALLLSSPSPTHYANHKGNVVASRAPTPVPAAPDHFP